MYILINTCVRVCARVCVYEYAVMGKITYENNFKSKSNH